MEPLGRWFAGNCKFASSEPVIGPPVKVDAVSQRIIDTVLAVAQEFGLSTTFRVAGGWVRDNLLGVTSDDLDFALDDMTGARFASYMADYCDRHPNCGISEAHEIKANPDKSKHLATVTVVIHGLKVDFVNLRVETYGESRIPTMEMGTPDSDARRRDLTINALFYNVHTGQVEDFLGGQGLKDLGLDTGTIVIRTPRDPGKGQLESTVRIFRDDPLRMLRALRFYSRYPNAVMDPSIVDALSMPEVQERFTYVRGKKSEKPGAEDEPDKGVAPSRSGPELIKLFQGAKPAEALRLMYGSGFDKKVFDVPGYNALMDLTMEQRNPYHAYTLLEHTMKVVENMNKVANEAGLPKDTRGLLNFAALFHDLGKAKPGVGKPKEKDPAHYTYENHEQFSADIADEILRHVDVGSDDRQFVEMMVAMHMRPHRHRVGPEQPAWTPKAMGRFVRETRPHGKEDLAKDWWKYAMMLSMADVMSKGTGDIEAETAERWEHIKGFEEFLKPAPQKASLMKPLLNGHDLIKMFPDIKPTRIIDGKNFIKYIQDKMLDGQATGDITPDNVREKVMEIAAEMPDYRSTEAWVDSNCKLG